MQKAVFAPVLAAWLVSALGAPAALYYTSGTLNTVIPDANPAGISSTLDLGVIGPIQDVSLTFTVTGGANGDLSAYLSHDGILVPLLNRVGTATGNPVQSVFGFATAGFNNVTLADSGSGGSIHNAAIPGSLPSISYTPDGGSLASLNGRTGNGSWTIFFADMASGGGDSPSTLVNWSLEVTAVPEPVSTALAAFGGLCGLVLITRARPVRRRVHRWHVAFVRWVDAV